MPDGAPSADKTLHIRHGSYPGYIPNESESNSTTERKALVVDTNNRVSEASIIDDQIRFRASLKRYHWVNLQVRTLQGETLEVNLSKYRFYNRQGDMQKSLLKEVRDRTIDSKYGRSRQAGETQTVLNRIENDFSDNPDGMRYFYDLYERVYCRGGTPGARRTTGGHYLHPDPGGADLRPRR